MTEQDVKFLCKWAIENGQRQLTPVAKFSLHAVCLSTTYGGKEHA